jgi:thiol-disulfide isomerase/thioredoxin
MRNQRLVSLGIAMAMAVVIALIVGACGGGSSGAGAPTLQGTTLQGEAFDLARSTGKPTVVNFFASWCPPCNSEAPDLVDFAAAHPEVRFVGVAVNDAQADTQVFVTTYGVHYTVVMDPDGQIARDWGAGGIPATFFLDEDGRQQASVVGAATRAQFEEKLQEAQ